MDCAGKSVTAGSTVSRNWKDRDKSRVRVRRPNLRDSLAGRCSVADAWGALDPTIASEARDVDIDGGGRGGGHCLGHRRCSVAATALDGLLSIAHITCRLLHSLLHRAAETCHDSRTGHLPAGCQQWFCPKLP